MASGSMVGGGVGNEAPRERQRFSESKVYTRKLFRGPKKLSGTETVLASDSTSSSFPDVLLPETSTVPGVDPDAVNHLVADFARDLSGAGLETHDRPVPNDVIGSQISTTPVKNIVEANGDDSNAIELDTQSTQVESEVAKPQGCSVDDAVEHMEDHPLHGSVAERSTCSLEHATISESEPHLSKGISTADVAPSVKDGMMEGFPNETVVDMQCRPSIGTNSELPFCATISADVNGAPEAPHLENAIPEPVAIPFEDSTQGTRAVAVEDATTIHKHPVTFLDPPSDDSTSLNRQTEMDTSATDVGRNGELNNMKSANLSSTIQERVELRRKLESELLVVRSLVKRIEGKQGELGYGGGRGLRMPPNDNVDGARRVSSDAGTISVPREITTPITTPTPRQSRPLSHLSISVMENGLGVAESLEKEKRTPKANQFYRNSEFLLAKDKFPPAESNKKSKPTGKKHGREAIHGFGPNTKVFKSCSGLLERLMKHKHGWVFNNPVDVDGLRLHDYYTIIKCPMDLGTIKSRLGKNWYKAPEEFAEDVRLTFTNAMTYNPKGQDVHVMAEQLLNIFEEKWESLKLEYDRDMRFSSMYNMGFATPQPRKAPPLPVAPLDTRRMLSRSESMPYTSSVIKPKSVTTPGRTPALKKPKAKDPNKRDMTYEEKQKLSTNLQSLPSEKLDNIVQIIKKRNSTLSQHDDEIEVDIDSVDAETLWELDRFVTNYKKSLSKNKRKAELAMQARAAAEQKAQEKVTPIVVETPNATDINTEDMNVRISSPVQEEKQGDNHSKTSSSSSSSSDSGSSTSDSDSDSSSASGSDVGH